MGPSERAPGAIAKMGSDFDSEAVGTARRKREIMTAGCQGMGITTGRGSLANCDQSAEKRNQGHREHVAILMLAWLGKESGGDAVVAI